MMGTKSTMTNAKQHSVQYGTKEIIFTLSRSSRKDLQINVCPDLTVEARAPLGASIDEVKTRVKKRARWIIKQQQYFTQFHPLQPARSFVSGETHRYLGRQYRLKVEQSDKNCVKLSRGYLHVMLPEVGKPESVKKMVVDWYRNRASEIFQQELDTFKSIADRLDVELPKIRLRSMKTRWGSCTKNGVILLNTELIKANKNNIRYVILHELCHLKEYNHTKRFYALLDEFMPDWQKQKEQLNKMADLIL